MADIWRKTATTSYTILRKYSGIGWAPGLEHSPPPPPIIIGAQSKTDFSHEHWQTTYHIPWSPHVPKHLPTPLK